MSLNSPKPPKPTLAQQIFFQKQILNEREEGMSYEEYKLLRRQQTIILKALFKSKPDRRLSNLMSNRLDSRPLAATSKGIRRIIKQRRAS